jgi:hypothetical protein
MWLLVFAPELNATETFPCVDDTPPLGLEEGFDEECYE